MAAGTATPEGDAIDRGDFVAAARLCAKSAVVEWPLSNERMAAIEHYPGTWHASVVDVIPEGASVVTVTGVFDERTAVTAISFFTIRDGLIEKLVEYWPDPYEAPGWRSKWTEPLP